VYATAELLRFELEALHGQSRTVFVSAVVIGTAPNIDVRYRFTEVKRPATFWTELLRCFRSSHHGSNSIADMPWAHRPGEACKEEIDSQIITCWFW
jgi:hypothetical protein